MIAPLLELTAAAAAFVGTHLILSHPLRKGLVKRLGAMGFQGLYAVVALGAMVWMVNAFRAVPADAAPLWNGTGTIGWSVASLLTLIASVLLIGSLRGNPAMSDPRAGVMVAPPVRGVFHVTRHPMMWSFALWAAAHALVAGTPRVLILAGAIAMLALVGAALQDRKKAVLLGSDWRRWETRTSFWPHPGGLVRTGAGTWLAGIVLWIAATWGHLPLAAVPAGLWRWLPG